MPSDAHDAVLLGCVQAPALHTSLVHTLPSSVQAAVLFTFAGQPETALHVPSSVHTLPSLQSSGVPAVQVPL
jgi:hypothetical protein